MISDPAKLAMAVSSFSKLGGPKILVHGGGSEASKLAEEMGVKVNMVEGRRITDKDMIRIVTMVYAGSISKRITALLQAKSMNGLGLSGADGNTILSVKRPVGEIDYGHVGDVVNVNGVAIVNLLKAGFVPIFCALTHDGAGNLLNTNADTIAAEIAKELSKSYEVSLSFTFELAGVLEDVNDPSSLLTKITKSDFEKMKSDGSISRGMIPKVHNALEASGGGVSKVYICNYSGMDEPQKGSEICAN